MNYGFKLGCNWFLCGLRRKKLHFVDDSKYSVKLKILFPPSGHLLGIQKIKQQKQETRQLLECENMFVHFITQQLEELCWLIFILVGESLFVLPIIIPTQRKVLCIRANNFIWSHVLVLLSKFSSRVLCNGIFKFFLSNDADLNLFHCFVFCLGRLNDWPWWYKRLELTTFHTSHLW